MKCVLCHHGDLFPGTTTVTVERDGSIVVFKRVPASVCDNCGENYVDGEIFQRMEAQKLAMDADIKKELERKRERVVEQFEMEFEIWRLESDMSKYVNQLQELAPHGRIRKAVLRQIFVEEIMGIPKQGA